MVTPFWGCCWWREGRGSAWEEFKLRKFYFAIICYYLLLCFFGYGFLVVGSVVNVFVGVNVDLHGAHRGHLDSPWLTLTLTLKRPVLACTSTFPGFREHGRQEKRQTLPTDSQ